MKFQDMMKYKSSRLYEPVKKQLTLKEKRQIQLTVHYKGGCAERGEGEEYIKCPS
jgi:hypothetical protein